MPVRSLRKNFSIQLEKVVSSCATAFDFDQHVCLSEFYALLAANIEQLPLELELPAQAEFEAILAAACWESAAFSMVPRRAGLMLSKGPDGTALASIVLQSQPTEVTEFGGTPALAIAAAIASALQLEYSSI